MENEDLVAGKVRQGLSGSKGATVRFSVLEYKKLSEPVLLGLGGSVSGPLVGGAPRQ